MYRIAVIGRGLIGSAAARHLAETCDGIVAIGPDEPEQRATHSGVFGSHYDEGRLTRIVDPSPAWAVTAKHALGRYRDIEARSGVSFYTPVGYLGLGWPGSSYNADCAKTGAALGAEFALLSAAQIRARYPFLSISEDVEGLVETGGAGYISPRNLVRAQTRLAEQAGAHILRQAVRKIRPVTGGVEITLWDRGHVRAEKVLIAAGAFTELCGLSPTALGLTSFGRTVVLVRIEGTAAAALSTMPTMIDSEIDAYILPPIRYPDGHLYLKLGVGTPADPRFETLAGMQNWFKGRGSETDRALFTAHIKKRIPVLETCTHWHVDTCAVTTTRSDMPIIDFVQDDRIAVAVGGNGKGAKGSDEWGRLAACLISGADWSSEVAQSSVSRAAALGGA